MDANDITVRVRLEDGALWATADEYPGLFATGDTVDELRDSVEAGLSLYLAAPGQAAAKVTLGNVRLRRPVTARATAVAASS